MYNIYKVKKGGYWNEGKNIIWLDYCGYHLCERSTDLTIVQEAFIVKGRADLHKAMNQVKK